LASAEEMRVAAEDMRDNQATALRIADEYERLATRAEERSNGSATRRGREKQPTQ